MTAHAATTHPTGAIDFASRTRVVFGDGAIGRLGGIAQDLGYRRALVVSDPGVVRAGHATRALEALQAAGLETVLFSGVVDNPTDANIADGVTALATDPVDGLVAVGGGSAIDCAKGISLIATHGGRVADYRGTGKMTSPGLPLIAVPTTAGTGSEVQSAALISDAVTHAKMVVWDHRLAPRVAVLDPEVTVSLPRAVTAATGIDALAHAVESYVCARANRLSQCFAAAAWRLLAPALPLALDNPSNLVARGDMLFGATLAGLAIEQSMLGVAHSMANPLTHHYGVTHGIAVGIMLPHTVRFNGERPEIDQQYAALAGRPAADLADDLSVLLTSAGLPARLKACGVDVGHLPVLAEEAATQWTARFNPRPVTVEDILELYRRAW